MSAWNIYHKDGSKLTDVNGEQITVHGLEYSDSWMGECFLTINFKHEVPINFQIGDYIVYRGERFELNYEPGKDKQARPDTYGEGFVYDSVKFNALQDELARAEFLDVVLNDNELHYTALPKFPFYVQTLDDLLDRIQACLNEQIGAGLWKIYSRNKERSVQRGALESEWLSVYGEKTDDNVIESMSITVDSQTCWQALALVNEKWDINFIVRGRNIYVGTTGIQANHIFKYGLGNGLYEIVQNADSDQSVVTRLRAYGSEKNLPSHYYADLGVKYVANITKVVGASTNVELELDLDYIETYFKNPRKYIVSPETGEQSSGWVLKVTFDFKTEITGYVTQGYGSKKCRFYSELKGTQTDTGDEESKEKLDAFIAQVKAGNTKMYITSGLNKKNVPSSMKEYAKNLPNNMSINRLMLPGFPHVSLSDFYNTLTNEEKKYVNPTGRQHKFSTDPHRPYIDSINIEQIGLRSASQFFETDDKTNGVIEIYPTIEEMEIGGVRVDEIDEGVAPDDDGRFGDNETVKNVDIYLKKAIDFDINDLKDDDFSISMKDGMCGGRTFKVASSTKIDGRWRLTIERVKDDALELWFPYKDYPIKKGDHFVLTGITLPDSYVNAASLKLLKYAIAFIDKNDYTRYVYQPKVDEIFMARQHDLAEKDTTGVIKSLHDTLKAGDLMEFEDTDLRIGGVISIDQLTIKEEDGKIPTYDITLREDKEVGTIQKIQQQISSLQSGNGGTGAGLTTTQVKNQVATEGSKHFISKINDDTAKGTITWEKVQKFLQGMLVGGGSWTPDAEGRSHLITDYLEVRMKAIFEELVINKTSTIGGKEIISPAGGVVAHKVEEATVTYNNVSQKAYRCYFLAEQEGDAVDNDFAVGDQVRSESFNVRKGTYHKAGNHFYWRLVIGRDEDPVELEGKKYHYIDLSDTDCATASDVPAKGDVLNQCGNTTDVERQNCLIFSAVDTYSPSISLYHGINSYSFANREYVEYGVNKQNNKAFFNVYGDMYVGDRPTKENGYEGSSYIRYDSSTKQVSVKAKISAKSTVDGKELSQYFKKIGELQNQVDGAIETWFYDGVPTLENAPAISWKTDKDKEIHLGDLYYNNKTGKAYRFAKDSNTYKWTIITDTDIAKALSDARMAQETANGKMKVFSVQPTTPYQVGDIWVNATYPSDGSTYKNEVLRCQTNKAAGSQFAIGDWIKASKYTDDTVANAAKKTAEDAQKAAQTAQTDIKNLGKTVTDNKKEFDNYVTDGYLEPSEIAAMAQDSKRLEDDFAAAQKSYNEVKNAEVLKSTKELTDLNAAFATLTTAKTELVTDLSDISKRYNETDTDGKAAIVSAVGTKFTNFQSAYSAFYDKLGLANAYITSKIYGDLKQNITDLAGYKYLKDALGQTTDIDGGLVMTTLIALRDGDGNVQSGINGAIDKNRGKKSIATWWGGQMVDKDYNSGNLTPATSLIRFDGSGYLANGAIWWDVSGKVHADPTSFIISEKNLGAYLIFFEPTWKEGSAGTSVADLVSLKPNAPFSKLGVSGDATFEGAISFHGIKLTYDSTNKAIKIDGNLYATGGITAYGAGASTTGGGGGLNGSVKSYSSALKLTSESLSEIASAYSIKALDSRISSLEGGSAMDVSVSGSGNAVTAISKSGTTIIVTKGTTFLTSHQSLASYLTKTDAASLYQPKGNYLTAHQSLDGYVNAIAVSGSGNAVTAVTKSGKTITFTKGSTFSLNGHTHTFASLTSKPTSLSGYGITDGVNAVSVTGSGNAITTASISGHTLTLTKGSSFSLSNHTHYVGTTQVQGSSAEQALTGITRIDNILKLSKASVTVNTSYKAEQNRLVIYGNTYGNDANYIKSAGKLSYGDGGPQLVFSTSENPDASGVQSAALVYTDHDTIGAGVSLSFVTNQGDAYFIAPHIKALTAFQGNLAWSYITNKPTTLSGFGITDGLRSVTQPSGSNVFVTGISTSGTAITYTKSYTKKSLSAVGTSGWTNASIDGNIIPDMSFIAYWNGAYSGTSSNLAYCNKGTFGSFAIKNSLAFSELTSKPTTISGYGITDAYTKSQVDTIAAKYLPLKGGTLTGQLKIEASALNGAYNGLRIGDDCYIGDCNIDSTIGLMGVGNNNAGMVKFGKGGMLFGYNGSNHIASTTAQWTNLNADLLDGWHKNDIVWSGAVNSNSASLSHYWAKLFDITVTGNQYDDRNFTFLFSNGYNDTYSVVVLKIRQNGANDSGAYYFSISLRELVGNMSSRLRVYYNNATGNVQLWGNCQRQYGSLSYTIIKKTGRTSADFTSQGTLVTNTSFSAAQSLPATTGDSPYTLLDGATRIGIVNQADQLVTARTIWGQSFNGTANVSGALSGATTISASNTISTTLQNGALKIGNKLTPISAIDSEVIFNTGAAIRFGETAWDWNLWAGLKYTHSNKTIYLGIADGNIFNANTAQTGGTLKFPGITTITPDAAARIGGSGGDLYLGNANNTNWVKVQDMCSQVSSNNWKIMQGGYAFFKDITIINTATINGSTHINNLLTAKGIMPTTTDVNAFGTNVNNWDGSIAANVTNMFNGIPMGNIQVEYSMDNGATWNVYPGNPENAFNLVNDNVNANYYYLGSNNLLGDTEADKLNQIKKNQFRVTVKIPDEIYQELRWISVDVNNGVDIKCQVYFGSSTGGYTEYVSKIMHGWSHKCDICVGSLNVAAGNDNHRYVRLVFSHLNTHNNLRNGIVSKIRALALTKYNRNADRYTISTTGHIYDYDAYMNTYFPNSILAKGGVTAYQSSDIRLKQDLRKLDYLGIIKAMGGTFGFAWKKDNTRSIGWIAQHVLCNPHLKDIVETDEKGYYKINYWSPKLIATAFGAIEQVGDEVSRLKARVVFLESEVQRLSGDKDGNNKKRLDNKNINSLN
ncbi:MAG: Prophage endopeptidase tail [Bacteriophage sp.]|nr:MAG: Prophage endopeptidase tail [Bacteriophage sp.]